MNALTRMVQDGRVDRIHDAVGAIVNNPNKREEVGEASLMYSYSWPFSGTACFHSPTQRLAVASSSVG